MEALSGLKLPEGYELIENGEYLELFPPDKSVPIPIDKRFAEPDSILYLVATLEVQNIEPAIKKVISFLGYLQEHPEENDYERSDFVERTANEIIRIAEDCGPTHHVESVFRELSDAVYFANESIKELKKRGQWESVSYIDFHNETVKMENLINPNVK